MTGSSRPLRFGVVLISEGCSRAEWVDRCRRAEHLGYDVISAPDHLNLTSPFPSVVLAAEATQRPRVGTYVLNASFHNPALLARDVCTTDQFVDGRLEVGLGTGYVGAEFRETGIPFGTAARRVDRLDRTVAELDRLLRDPAHAKSVQQPRPPLLIGGHGDRVLTMAARRAEIVSFIGAEFRPEHGRMVVADHGAMAERTSFVRRAAAQRAEDAEFNVLCKATLLTNNRRAGAESLRHYGPQLSVDQLLEVPTLLIGTAQQIAEQVREHREVLGISYFTVLEQSMEAFGDVIELL
ncbi:TIGR03621 family F420-dependent LLM class oxidoreductase [Amycolatopsis rubida]|uniref:Probable F420-dependent oxidoreductase, MSMEG_2516 family n=1 Tax=Amycolatopsis rubida TaxID=112413 RepID=A0A1I5TNI9_9PSEU|nr:TIGR03621 family F420-dependent LLM class oxidoreductase [Amycolatopsis rubida]SFP84603.1 probable F420-dependent oxidoreductase, MSMEG_2516 family [Amycolatopsis rubida]